MKEINLTPKRSDHAQHSNPISQRISVTLPVTDVDFLSDIAKHLDLSRAETISKLINDFAFLHPEILEP